MKNHLFPLVLFLFSFDVDAQDSNLEISGVVKDSSDITLPSASVVLLHAKDSVMSAFTITDKEGVFRFKKVKPGDYILQITYIGYANYAKRITINTAKSKYDFGEIRMQTKSEVLDEVSIQADAIPIQIKKDTVEYNAASFKTRPNALVEDLLKRLPGVEVEDDGTIKAHGEEVKKVKVDGKEFFGNDTRIATRNLPADAVDKVQVYDEMSEMSQFTGIDDGERDKTINLALKEGKNKGYFGKLSAGYGTDNRYEGRMNINRFRKGLQLSVIGDANNINQQSYSASEFGNMMGGFGGMMGAFKVMRLGAQESSSSGSGINTSQMGGVNLNAELSERTTLYGSYFFNHINNRALSDINRTNFLDNQTYKSLSNSDAQSGNYSHRLNLNLRKKIDETQDLSVRTNVSISNGNSDRIENSSTYDTLGLAANASSTSTNATNNAGSFGSKILYRKRFGEAGRNIVGNLTVNGSNVNNDNFLRSITQYNYFIPPGTDSLYQHQTSTSNQLDYSGEIRYTEPLGRKNYLEAGYQYTNFSNTLNKDFFDIISDIEIINPQLSTSYNRDYTYHRGGLAWSRSRNKSTLRIGADVQDSNLKGKVVDNPGISKEYIYALPEASYRFEIGGSNHVNISYSTNVSEPSLQQLQPIVDNTNPLNIYVGNQDLKPQYSHRVNVGFTSFDQFNFRSFFLHAMGSYTRNKITNATFIDTLLRQVTTPVNVDYDYTLSGFMNFGTPLKFIGSKINIGGNTFITKSLVFVNQKQNHANRFNTQVNFTIENIKKELFDLRVGTKLLFNQTRYSENKELNQDFMRQIYFADLSIYWGKWTLNGEMSFSQYGGDAFPDRQNVPILKAYISRTFLKSDKGEFRIQGFDLLNKNTGINRTSDLNYIQEEKVNVLGRYITFSFTYSLRAIGGRNQ